MTKNKLIIALFTGLSLAFTAAQAQDAPAPTPSTTATAADKPLKIGYTNVNYILSVSPRAKEIESELKTRGVQLQKEIESKMKELEDKYEAYQKGQATMLESIRKDKEAELNNLQSSIRNLQQNAQQEIKNKEDELVRPELEKIYKAINEVANEQAYTYVLNSDQVILFASEKFDVTEAVMKKLGINPAAVKNDAKPSQVKPATPAPAPSSTKPATGGGKKKK